MSHNTWHLAESFNYNRYEEKFNVGDVVKLSFHDWNKKEEGGESMWVTIVEAWGSDGEETSHTQFMGTLANTPLFSFSPKRNTPFKFKISHILLHDFQTLLHEVTP